MLMYRNFSQTIWGMGALEGQGDRRRIYYQRLSKY